MEDSPKKCSVMSHGENPHLEDDKSLASKSSIDAVLNTILQGEGDPLDDDMVIDTADKDACFDDLVEPLDDLEEEFSDDTASKLENVFSPEEKQGSPQQIASSISHDSSTETVTTLNEEEITSMLTGELLEPPPIQRPGTPNDIHSEADFLNRVLGWLSRLETPEIVQQAETIVSECQCRHQKGDDGFSNLSGSIFDRLVQLLGAPKFNEIYRRSRCVDPRSYTATPHFASPSHGPKTIPLAIAYGIHLATSTNGSESPKELIKHGVTTLNSMSEKERAMFWAYMTKKGTSS